VKFSTEELLVKGEVFDRGTAGEVFDRETAGEVIDRGSAGEDVDRETAGEDVDRGSSVNSSASAAHSPCQYSTLLQLQSLGEKINTALDSGFRQKY
jgi:hypothetical protein